jgi:hypothetical protein
VADQLEGPNQIQTDNYDREHGSPNGENKDNKPSGLTEAGAKPPPQTWPVRGAT